MELSPNWHVRTGTGRTHPGCRRRAGRPGGGGAPRPCSRVLVSQRLALLQLLTRPADAKSNAAQSRYYTNPARTQRVLLMTVFAIGVHNQLASLTVTHTLALSTTIGYRSLPDTLSVSFTDFVSMLLKTIYCKDVACTGRNFFSNHSHSLVTSYTFFLETQTYIPSPRSRRSI